VIQVYVCNTVIITRTCKRSVSGPKTDLSRAERAKSNQTNYITVRPKVDRRADQLSLPHV